MSKNRIDIIEQRLEENGQPADERLETLHKMADDIHVFINIMDNRHSDFNKTFIAPPVKKLWERYFMIMLKILEFSPETTDLNQSERAQKVLAEMEKISPIEKSLKTICRWDALKTDDLIK